MFHGSKLLLCNYHPYKWELVVVQSIFRLFHVISQNLWEVCFLKLRSMVLLWILMIGLVFIESPCYAADSDDIVSEDILLVDVLVSTEINGDGRFNYPMGIAIDTSGDIYVVGSINSRIQKFDKDGEFLQFIGPTVWGVQGFVDRELTFPIGIALDENANIYVTDFGVEQIKVFDKNGTFLRNWDVKEGVVRPGIVGIAWGNNSVYITDKENHRILRYSPEGTLLSEWGQEGVANGELDYPSGIAVDESGKVHVVDVNNQRIQIFDTEGNYLDSFASGIISEDSWPMLYDIMFDSEKIYVSASRNYSVRIFDELDTSISVDVYIKNKIFHGDIPEPNGIDL